MKPNTPIYDPRWGFYRKAKEYQLWYKLNILNIKDHDALAETMLTDKDAQSGANFYKAWPDLLDQVNKRFEFKGGNKKMWKNMLRSEHIGFNFFIPINDLKGQKFTIRFLNTLLPDANIKKIITVEIEYAPKNNENKKLLNDNTSFDTYIEYINTADQKCGIGIEIKYTEKSYPYGKKEKERMFDKDDYSPYHQTSFNSDLYHLNTLSKLREKPLKQLWRNHLLGEKMKQLGLIKQFTSINLYPSGNEYQDRCVKKYQSLLSEQGEQQFVPITFEKFIHLGKTYFTKPAELAWMTYLNNRYIVK